MNNLKNFKEQDFIKGYISPKEVFKYVTQEEIYELVFKFKPVEYQYTVSPLREDKNPNCWFEYDDLIPGKLLFRDWAYGNRPLDCFDLVRLYYNIPNFYQTLVFIKKTFYYKKPITKEKRETLEKTTKKSKIKGVDLKIRVRDFDQRDGYFWGSCYGILKENLFEDSVFPINIVKIIFKDPNKEAAIFTIKDIAYSFSEFPEGRKKIYRPSQNSKFKFLTNCRKNDIGGLKTFPLAGRLAVITKSYKDYRVLKNQGIKVIWFQNEGMVPDIDILKKILHGYDEVVVFFDNDRAGIEASSKITAILKTFKSSVREVRVPTQYLKENITDPADYRRFKGSDKLRKLLRNLKLIHHG